MNTQNKVNGGSRRAELYRGDARHGFTLVEMLVVILVIGILAALITPVISRAREAARRTACTSNMRQLGMAFQQYMQDNSGKLPNTVDGDWGAGQTNSWSYYSRKGSGGNTAGADTTPQFDPTKGSLFQYAKSEAIYVCPSDPEAVASKQSYAVNSCVFFRDAPESYTNSLGQAGTDAGSVRRGKSQVRFRNPTEWMLLAEETRDNTRAYATTTDDGYLNLKDSGQDISYQNYFAPRHTNGSVITFLDGHSKWYSVENILKNRFQIGGPNVDPAKTLADGCPAGVQ